MALATPAHAADVVVPDVLGQPELNAQDAIEAEDLVMQLVYVSEPRYADGIVLRQAPAGGTLLAEGRSVRIEVNSISAPLPTPGPTPGPATDAIVPDLVGSTYLDALAALRSSGLVGRANLVGARVPGAVSTVMSQDPAAGFRVAQGTEVRFDHSASGSGSTSIPAIQSGVVPDFLGMTESEALAAGRAADLLMHLVGLPMGTGTVSRATSQTVAAGTRVALHAVVQVSFRSTGGTTPGTRRLVPDFVFMTEAEARTAAATAGVAVTMGPIASFVDPRVQSQQPAAGSVVGSTPVQLDFNGGGTDAGATVLPDFTHWVVSRVYTWATNNGKTVQESSTTPGIAGVRRTVTRQTPTAGGALRGISTVLIVTGNEGAPSGAGTRGPAAMLPDLSGWTVQDVRDFVRGTSIALNETWTVDPPIAGVERVAVEQFPLVGTPLASVTDLDVVFGNEGSPTRSGLVVTVPSINGGENAHAYSLRLQAAGFTPDFDRSKLFEAPIATDPAEGVAARRGQTIKILFR